MNDFVTFKSERKSCRTKIYELTGKQESSLSSFVWAVYCLSYVVCECFLLTRQHQSS